MDKAVEDVWLSILDASGLPDARTEPWLTTCSPVSVDNGVLLVDVPNVFAKEQITNRFIDKLNEAALKVGGVSSIQLRVIGDSAGDGREWDKRAKDAAQPRRERSNLNPAYVFTSFIVGKSNRLAHAASLAVAETPGEAYNPLFIWGGVGLGKTHLMHAICHYALDKRSTLNVTYASSEQFINEFIQSIRNKNSDDFKKKYRNSDILLIDDIQFLGGKDGSQEEFFHTFNSLRETNRQIVICSDRQPRELRNIEERLVSRFEWGLVTDIQPPDLETRIAILQNKAGLRGSDIADDVISFLAQGIPSNIRELEGALNRVIAMAELYKEKITVENTRVWLKDILRTDAKMPATIDAIKQLVADRFEMSVDDLSSSKRTAEIALARQVAMYLCRENTDISLQQIGLAFNKKDHTTVIHAHRKIISLIKDDDNVKNIVENIASKL